MSNKVTSPLDSLKRNFILRRVEYSESSPTIGNPDSIEDAVKKIKRRVGEKQGKPATDRIQEALSILFTQGSAPAMETHLRYVCWGLLETWGDSDQRILTETKLLGDILAYLSDLDIDRLSMSAWRGLVSSYFGWAPDASDPIAYKNWIALRDFLSRRLALLATSRVVFRPAWLQVLQENLNLLGESPCDRYGHALLKGDDKELEPLKNELRIPSDSWFWNELILSQARAASQLDDSAFLEAIEILLPRLTQYRLSIDACLKILLERYYGSKQKTSPHIALREHSISAWGSPHLSRNARWGLVQPETKAMVQNWLVVKALDDFFRLLQEDRAADEGRLNFWLMYQNSIEYFHFALGPEAHDNPHEDYRSFRARFKDHISTLSSPGKRENNAFILKLGDYWVVEFGALGNACYVYHQNSLPFDMSSRWLDLNRDLKKRGKALLRLSHMSGWQPVFTQKLAELGIFKDHDSIIRSSARQTERQRQDFQHQANQTESKGDPDIKLVTEYGLNYEDLRRSGGVFLVYFDRQHGIIATKLWNAGFKYYAGRGWWKR